MKLSEPESLARLASEDHGVLATLHTSRGIDMVPVVYVLVEGRIGIPIDTIKPKSATRLQRDENSATDPRATLLIEGWDREDWSQLWWVRAHLTRVSEPSPDIVRRLSRELASRYAQYRDEPFASVMVFEVGAVYGWSAAESGPTS